MGYFRPWEFGSMGLWGHRTLGPYDFGTIGLWDHRILGPGNFEIRRVFIDFK